MKALFYSGALFLTAIILMFAFFPGPDTMMKFLNPGVERKMSLWFFKFIGFLVIGVWIFHLYSIFSVEK